MKKLMSGCASCAAALTDPMSAATAAARTIFVSVFIEPPPFLALFGRQSTRSRLVCTLEGNYPARRRFPVPQLDETAQDIVRRFGLTPHPEGGYYREVYR